MHVVSRHSERLKPQILGKCLLKDHFRPCKVRRVIPNVLAERYASPALQAIWSAEGRIVLEREFWIAVMKAQRDLGLDIPAEAIAAYEKVKDQVDPASIMARERITRHDVKARIEEFNDLAGHEQVHKGMTSRDLTENVEQLQVYRSLLIVRDKTVATLRRFRERSEQWSDLILTARTHNVAAQPTTLGKRIAMFGEELLGGLHALDAVIASYSGPRPQGRGRHPDGPAFPVRRRCRESRRAGKTRRRPSRHARRVDQRRPGLSALAGFPRGRRPHRSRSAARPRSAKPCA